MPGETVTVVVGDDPVRLYGACARAREMTTVVAAQLSDASRRADQSDLHALMSEALNESLGRDAEQPGEGTIYVLKAGLHVAAELLGYAAGLLEVTPEELWREIAQDVAWHPEA